MGSNPIRGTKEKIQARACFFVSAFQFLPKQAFGRKMEASKLIIHKNKMENENNKLAESVEQLSASVKRTSSFRRSFFQGIFFGLGSAIGASIIAAILIGAFNWFVHSVNGVPILQNMENVRWQK